MPAASQPTPPRLLFLPGASGDREFWRPVAQRLPATWETVLLNWPGAGEEPQAPGIAGADDLVARLAEEFDGPADIVAQSMGGIVAVRLAHAHPARVRSLVLVATSGGVDVTALGGADWRPAYREAFPRASSWIFEQQPDLTPAIRQLAMPALLIWGDADPISPPAVGEHLAALLPHASLHIIPGGTHALAREQPDTVAGLIEAHLRAR